jgi:hypothetical protein
MDLTRREFLGCAAGAAGALGLALSPSPGKPTASPSLQRDRWRTFSKFPVVRSTESLRGYQAVIPIERQQWIPGERDPAERCALIVVPSALNLGSWRHHLRQALRHGSTVIIETGAGFANHLTFCNHRRSLREDLRIHVAAPVNLWASGNRSPYIDFIWPRRATIRDFSRVVPPADQPGDDVIAWAGDMAVAFRRRVGKGTLIYLGSPVGPALWAGDAEARRWFYAVALAA